MLIHWLIVVNLIQRKKTLSAAIGCFYSIIFSFSLFSTDYTTILIIFVCFIAGFFTFFIWLEKRRTLTLFFLCTKFDMIESLSCVCFVCFSLMASFWWWVKYFLFSELQLLQCSMCVTPTTTTAKSKSEWLINTQRYVFFGLAVRLVLSLSGIHTCNLTCSFMHCLLFRFCSHTHARTAVQIYL